MRICGVFTYYLLQSQSEKQQCLSYVYWTIFCYTLIDLLACVPYYSMHVLNKHEGLSKKKKITCKALYWPQQLYTWPCHFIVMVLQHNLPQLEWDR